ncbi:MAG: DUF4342 domain-containing protein [Lachnospiraceae bacterium]|nr:DUF4342 domain-containing protein [Lachnospiraceae bacterium]
MERLEKVEKIREKTGVSYEEAKNALEACEYDVLDALVYLETLGKINREKLATYSTVQTTESSEFTKAQETYENSCKDTSFGEAFGRVFDKAWKLLKKAIQKGCNTTFVVKKKDKIMFNVPVIVLVLLTLFAFWVTIPLLIVGMFFDCRYSFLGFESTMVDINELCEKASDSCENIKKEFNNK